MKSSKGKARRFGVAKAIHNNFIEFTFLHWVVLYPKDTEKWKQFTTISHIGIIMVSCFVSQRYWKMKAIHNFSDWLYFALQVVLYPKDTEKWKQFTTQQAELAKQMLLFCIPKILKNESNSQPSHLGSISDNSCFVSQRYWKMKAIHNYWHFLLFQHLVVLYPKDTEKWKQFTTIDGESKEMF